MSKSLSIKPESSSKTTPLLKIQGDNKSKAQVESNATDGQVLKDQKNKF